MSSWDVQERSDTISLMCMLHAAGSVWEDMVSGLWLFASLYEGSSWLQPHFSKGTAWKCPTLLSKRVTCIQPRALVNMSSASAVCFE